MDIHSAKSFISLWRVWVYYIKYFWLYLGHSNFPRQLLKGPTLLSFSSVIFPGNLSQRGRLGRYITSLRCTYIHGSWAPCKHLVFWNIVRTAAMTQLSHGSVRPAPACTAIHKYSYLFGLSSLTKWHCPLSTIGHVSRPMSGSEH